MDAKTTYKNLLKYTNVATIEIQYPLNPEICVCLQNRLFVVALDIGRDKSMTIDFLIVIVHDHS